jgi:hypothetical protein|tara:strand:+ start:334 stop:552 length:219 start_codon:yes stop_codon:yes gene_type:complete
MKAERLQKAYQWGYNCFVKGLMSSPFKADSMTDLEWHRGFNAAYYQNIDFLNGNGAKPTEYETKARPKRKKR